MTDQLTAGPALDEDALEKRMAALTPAQRELLEKVLAESGVDVGLRRRPDGAPVPASYEQERLWFMTQLVAHPEIFHVPTALWFRGPLDVDALRSAIEALVDRHESLRTTFRDDGDGPQQIVREHVHVPLEIEDHRGADDPVPAARRRASDSIVEPFDLGAGPLLRCRLYRTADDEHMFVLTEHHIVSDYWSLGIVLADLGALYAAATGAGPLPEPLELHYPDFAYRQRSTLERTEITEQLDWWRERLDGLPESLDLPTDRPRPAIRSSQGRFHWVDFGPEVVDPLRAMAREHSTTLLSAFLAGYVGLLSRIVDKDSIVVGVPVAGRPRPELQQMVGYFLNWLSIRVEVSDRPSMRELVARTASAMAEALAHQDVPFDMLVSELRPSRTPGTTPVFQTSFSLRDGAPQPPVMPGVDVSFADMDGSATHFDLMVELWQEDDRVLGYFPYDEELFDDATVGTYARWFRTLLALGTASPDVPVGALPIFDDGEQALLRGDLVTDVPPADPEPATVHARFAAEVARRPDAPAVGDDATRLTYAELDARADRVANLLLARGVAAGDVVGLFLEPDVDMVAAVLGVLRCGAAYLPIDPEGPAQRAIDQLAGCDVRVVLAAPQCRVPEDAAVTTVVLDAAALADALSDPVRVDVPAGSPAYVIYTSGSTGTPKGVLVSHANVLRLFSTAGERFDITEDDVWTLFHSYAFDFSVWELWGPLLHGGRLVVVPQWATRAPDVVAEILADEGVTVLSQTPSAFAQLARVVTSGETVPELALRYVVFGGEALAHSTLRDWFGAFGDERPRLVNMYGITETTVHVTFREVTRADTDRGESLIGVPLGDLSVYLLDDDLRPVPDGVPGEMFVGGPGVALGYQADPALTARRMLPDPFTPHPGRRMYRSGDVAVLRRDGELAYLGRRDDQHKIRGHRVELGEVRAALDALDTVAASAVVVDRDRVGSAVLVAYVVPAGDGVTGTRVRRALQLPEWMVPSSVEIVGDLPLTRNGKLDRHALAAARDAGRSREPSGPAPDGDAATLATIWSELLGLDGIGLDDDFFELGGHSLMAVQMVSRIRGEFGADVPMAVLFDRPRLREMAEEVTAIAAGGPSAVADDATATAPIEDVRADVAARLAALERPTAPRPATGTDTVLVTGATGFVGAFVLADVLGRGLRAVCLVRGGDARRDDLLANATRLGLREPVERGIAEDRVEIVDGDVGAPRLGLDDATHRRLADGAGAIVHTAAWVNHLYPYAQLAPANVHAVGALLELAGTGRRTSLVHVSTSAVAEAYPVDEVVGPRPLHTLPTGPAGYVRSKAAAELYVEHAGEFDVPGAVVRVPSIFGDTERHQINDADAVWGWCRAMIDTGGYPESFDLPGNELFQALPADVLARGLVDEALTTHEPGCRFVNAIPDATGHTSDLVAAFDACGIAVAPVPDAQWYAAVGRLDPAENWVAGIAAGVANAVAAEPGPRAARRLHRFSPGGVPVVAERLAQTAIHRPSQIEGYIRTVAAR